MTATMPGDAGATRISVVEAAAAESHLRDPPYSLPTSPSTLSKDTFESLLFHATHYSTSSYVCSTLLITFPVNFMLNMQETLSH